MTSSSSEEPPVAAEMEAACLTPAEALAALAAMVNVPALSVLSKETVDALAKEIGLEPGSCALLSEAEMSRDELEADEFKKKADAIVAQLSGMVRFRDDFATVTRPAENTVAKRETWMRSKIRKMAAELWTPMEGSTVAGAPWSLTEGPNPSRLPYSDRKQEEAGRVGSAATRPSGRRGSCFSPRNNHRELRSSGGGSSYESTDGKQATMSMLNNRRQQGSSQYGNNNAPQQEHRRESIIARSPGAGLTPRSGKPMMMMRGSNTAASSGSMVASSIASFTLPQSSPKKKTTSETTPASPTKGTTMLPGGRRRSSLKPTAEEEEEDILVVVTSKAPRKLMFHERLSKSTAQQRRRNEVKDLQEGIQKRQQARQGSMSRKELAVAARVKLADDIEAMRKRHAARRIQRRQRGNMKSKLIKGLAKAFWTRLRNRVTPRVINELQRREVEAHRVAVATKFAVRMQRVWRKRWQARIVMRYRGVVQSYVAVRKCDMILSEIRDFHKRVDERGVQEQAYLRYDLADVARSAIEQAEASELFWRRALDAQTEYCDAGSQTLEVLRMRAAEPQLRFVPTVRAFLRRRKEMQQRERAEQLALRAAEDGEEPPVAADIIEEEDATLSLMMERIQAAHDEVLKMKPTTLKRVFDHPPKLFVFEDSDSDDDDKPEPAPLDKPKRRLSLRVTASGRAVYEVEVDIAQEEAEKAAAAAVAAAKEAAEKAAAAKEVKEVYVEPPPMVGTKVFMAASSLLIPRPPETRTTKQQERLSLLKQ